jgi:hypothetical protein
MLVSLDKDILDSAVKSVVKIAGAGEAGLIFFKVMGPNLMRVSSVNKGNGVAIYFPCKVEKKSDNKKFAIEPQPILSAISNRKNVQLRLDESMVTVLAKGHKAELVTTAADAERVLPEEIKNGDNSMKIPHELIEFIRMNIDAIELKPTLETYSYMPVAVKVTEKGTIMVCYDNWHMAYVTTKKITGDIQFCLPVNSLSLLAKEFRGKSYKVNLTESALYAYNDSFELALPLPQQDAQNIIPADQAFELAKTIRQQEGVTVLLAAEDVKTLSTNMEAVYKKGEQVDFEVDKTECKVMLKSTHGKVTSTARCRSSKKISFRTGFGFLRDILSKVGGEKLEVQVVPEKMMFFNNKNKTFMIALTEKDKE